MAEERDEGIEAWEASERSSEERRRQSHLDESSAAFRRVSPWIV